MRSKFLMLVGIVCLFVSLSSFSFAEDNLNPRIDVSLLKYTPNPVQPGQVMDVVFEVENVGSLSSTSIEVVEEYPFTVEHSQDVEDAKHIAGLRFTREVQYRIRVAEDAKDGITPLRLRYTQKGVNGGFVEETFDINVKTFDARLNLVKIEQVPEEIAPGEKGVVYLTLLNSDDTILKNIDVNIDLTQSFDINSNMDNMIAMQAMVNSRLEEVNRRVASGLSPLRGLTPMMNGDMEGGQGILEFKSFAPVGTSTQKSIAIMQPSEAVTLEFEVMALPDALPNVYATPLYLSYNDEDNNPFHVRVDVPLLINSEPELYVEMKETNLRTTDFAADVVFTVANRGLSELRYITLELEEDETITLLTAPQSVYVGNLAPGESAEATFKILAESEHITLPITAEYRDSYNQPHVDEKVTEFTILNRNYYRDLPFEMWIAWLVLGGVILLLTGFYVRQMSKSKSE